MKSNYLMKNICASERCIYLDVVKSVAMYLICFIHYVMLKPTILDNFVDMFCFAGVGCFF